jgi:hypothetical protein
MSLRPKLVRAANKSHRHPNKLYVSEQMGFHRSMNAKISRFTTSRKQLNEAKKRNSRFSALNKLPRYHYGDDSDAKYMWEDGQCTGYALHPKLYAGKSPKKFLTHEKSRRKRRRRSTVRAVAARLRANASWEEPREMPSWDWVQPIREEDIEIQVDLDAKINVPRDDSFYRIVDKFPPLGLDTVRSSHTLELGNAILRFDASDEDFGIRVRHLCQKKDWVNPMLTSHPDPVKIRVIDSSDIPLDLEQQCMITFVKFARATLSVLVPIDVLIHMDSDITLLVPHPDFPEDMSLENVSVKARQDHESTIETLLRRSAFIRHYMPKDMQPLRAAAYSQMLIEAWEGRDYGATSNAFADGTFCNLRIDRIR